MEFLLAAVALIFGVRLAQGRKRRSEISVLVLAGAFPAVAVALVASGTAHVFVDRLGGLDLERLFLLASLLVGLASFSLAAGVILACHAGVRRRLLLMLVATQLIVFSFSTIARPDGRIVALDLALGLLLAAALEVWAWKRRRAQSAPWIVAGVALGLATLAYWWLGLPTASLGHRMPSLLADLVVHLGLLAALYLLYRGGRRLHDRVPV